MDFSVTNCPVSAHSRPIATLRCSAVLNCHQAAFYSGRELGIHHICSTGWTTHVSTGCPSLRSRVCIWATLAPLRVLPHSHSLLLFFESNLFSFSQVLNPLIRRSDSFGTLAYVIANSPVIVVVVHIDQRVRWHSGRPLSCGDLRGVLFVVVWLLMEWLVHGLVEEAVLGGVLTRVVSRLVQKREVSLSEVDFGHINFIQLLRNRLRRFLANLSFWDLLSHETISFPVVVCKSARLLEVF